MRNPWLFLVLATAWLCRRLVAEEDGIEHHGWQQAENEACSCQPKCNSCLYGDCISPGSCRCWPGYKWQELPPAGCRPLAQLLLPAEQCLDQCPGHCWRSQQQQQLRCFPICRQGQSKLKLEMELELESDFCLQADECVCNGLTQLLICQNKDQERPQQYACLHPPGLQQEEVAKILAVKVRRSQSTENWNSARRIQMDELRNHTNRSRVGARNNSMRSVYYANNKATTVDPNLLITLPGQPIKDSTMILALLVFSCILIVIIVLVCIFTSQFHPCVIDDV